MKLGFLEIVLLVAIITLLFGPNIIRFVRRYRNRHQMRSDRLRNVAERRRAEAQAERLRRRAQLQLIACSVGGGLVLFLLCYLSFWNVGEVNAYTIGYSSVFAQEETLLDSATLETVAKDTKAQIALADYRNLTQIRAYNDWIYASTQDGKLIRVRENGTGLTELISVDGTILGFDFDAEGNIIFTNAMYDTVGGALLKASFDGFAVTVECLASIVDDRPLYCPTGVAVASDGLIYFLDASMVSAVEQEGVAQSVRNAQVAHAKNGMLYVYDPTTEQCEVVAKGLCVGSGLALSADGKTLYVTQLANASLWAVDVTARNVSLSSGVAGVQTIAKDLPSYPAGVSVAEDDTLWVSFVSGQMPWFEQLSDKPAWRKVLLRLPQGTRDALLRYDEGGVQLAQLTAEGEVICVYQSASTRHIGQLVSATIQDDRVYFAQANDSKWIGYFERNS